MKIRVIYDFWGVGIYWTLIEFLREQKDYKYEYSESNMQILCDIIGCKDLSKFNNFIKDSVKFDLFKVEYNLFFSQSLINKMSKWETCKANGSKPKIPKEQPEEKPNGSEIEAKWKRNRSQIEAKWKPNGSIRGEYIIEEEKKEENITANVINIPFSEFWDLYPKERKSNKKYCDEYWNKNLNDSERELIIKQLPNYIKSVSELQFIKQSEFFFKNKKYLDGAFIYARQPEKQIIYPNVCR